MYGNYIATLVRVGLSNETLILTWYQLALSSLLQP